MKVNVVNNILNRIRINPLIFGFYLIILLLPEFIQQTTRPWWRFPFGIFVNVINYAVLSWLVCVIAKLTTKKLGILWHICFHSISIVWVCVHYFLYYRFHRRVDAFTLQLIKETTLKEASEFVGLYILNVYNLAIVVVVVLLLTLYVYCIKRTKNIAAFPRNFIFTCLWSILVVLVLSQIYFFIGSGENVYRKSMGMPIKTNAFFSLRLSVLQMDEFEEENEKCANTLSKIKEKVECNANQPDVVLIIGESFDKHHASLYGYNLNTTPRLDSLKRNNSLFVFTDVVAPSNMTTMCFKSFLSLALIDKDEKWYERSLFPAIMKNSGWNVIFYSNQFCLNEELGPWDVSMAFMNHPKIADKMFCYRNSRTFDYDMQMIDDYEKNRSEIEKSSNNLIIFHLYGQHILPTERFPHTEKFFTKEDIKRNDINESQRQVVADYDNATLYNDKVIDRIIKMYENKNAIVLYFSDHGEEIYEFRDQLGRSDLNIDVDPRTYYHQLEIPFLVYLSPQCRANTNIAERLNCALDRPITTDCLSYFIFDMISPDGSIWNNSSMSPLSKDYQYDNKRRIMNTNFYYEDIMRK